MFKHEKKPISCIVRKGLSATAFVLATGAISLACAAQSTTYQELGAAPDMAMVSIPGASGGISRVTSGAETLHVLVGHSLFLNTRSRLRRVYVADPNILNSVTLSPNQIVVTAMTSGTSSLILLDETGQALSYVVSSDLDVAGLRVAMTEAMRGNAVDVEGSGNRITLSGQVGSTELVDTAVKLAGLYSKEVLNALIVEPDHVKQVRLKVRILEVDRSRALQLGINLFNPGGNTSFLAATTTSQYPSTAVLSGASTADAIGTLTTSNPLNFLLYSSKLNLGATVQDLESKQVLQILAEPTITAISGEKADFLSGGEFPFPMIQPGGAGSAPVITIQFQPYGVKLEFTPLVNEDGTIRLKVSPEVSALDYTNAVTISGYTIPAISTRRAQTEVELRNNQSFAISGLLDQRTTDIMSKNPGAASIPILGALFKSKNVNHSTTELVVIITPTLVDPLTDSTNPAQPDLPIPTLNTNSFDKSLGKNLNPQPSAPPLNPIQPSSKNQVPDAYPSTAPMADPATRPAQDVTLAQAAQKTQAFSTQYPAIGSGSTTSSANAPNGSASSVLGSEKSAAVGADSLGNSQVSSSVVPPTASSSDQPRRYVFDNPSTAIQASGQQVDKLEVPTRLMVQVMELSSMEEAESMVVSLKRRGYNVAVNHDTLDSLLHLEVGPFSNKTDAEAMRKRLLIDGYNATVK